MIDSKSKDKSRITHELSTFTKYISILLSLEIYEETSRELAKEKIVN
jgi:hypothetical protein